MSRFEGHVCDGAADQRPCQAPRGLQAHHAHLSGRCREHQSLQTQVHWSEQPVWVKSWKPQNTCCNMQITCDSTVTLFFHNQAPVWNLFMLLLQPTASFLTTLWRSIHWSWAARSCPRKCLTWEGLQSWHFTWRASGFLTKTLTVSSASTSVCWSPYL